MGDRIARLEIMGEGYELPIRSVWIREECAEKMLRWAKSPERMKEFFSTRSWPKWDPYECQRKNLVELGIETEEGITVPVQVEIDYSTWADEDDLLEDAESILWI